MSYHACSLTPIMRVSGEREIDRWIGAAVMWTLGQSIMVKRENSRKVKLSISLLIYDPTLTYGRKLFVVTGHVPPGWPRGRPRTHWREYIFWLPWEDPGVPPDTIEEVPGGTSSIHRGLGFSVRLFNQNISNQKLFNLKKRLFSKFCTDFWIVSLDKSSISSK